MVLSVERFPPQLSQVPAVIVREVRTMLDGRDESGMVPDVILLALRFVIFSPSPWKSPENLSETTFIVQVVALI